MLREERGVTLVELLIAVAITSVLAVAVVRTISTAQTAIDRSSAQTVSSVQTMRFVGLLKYDLAGAADVYVYGSTVPADTSHVCSTWTSGDTAAWTDPNAPQFVRELFSVAIPTVTPPTGTLLNFLPTRTQLVGYEVRRQSGNTNYDLFRVVCDGGQQVQRVLSLGSNFQASADGTSTLKCYTANGSLGTVSVGQSTLSSTASPVCASFGFAVPYTGSATAIQRLLSDASLQRMKSAVTPS